MADVLKAACVQMTSGSDVQENLKVAEGLIREAVSGGAQLVVTPEVTDQVLPRGADRVGESFVQDEHPGVAFFAALAQELSIHLVIGSMLIKTASDKVANRSFLFAPDGSLQDSYDKIHLYDVDLPTGESWWESNVFTPGDRLVVSDCQDFKLGLSVCYDVRFPHLYRDLAKNGAEILTIPAAFTVPTGKAHWEVLLRARAIETGSFVLAADQCGDHMGMKQSYGHSMIISPWGEILAAAGEEVGIIAADLNLEEVAKARRSIPALQHDRKYTVEA
ncbi:MAG: amidohydrolase [Micavibrio sp.]|nr:MAG: amidohydrolase [Micavibrio sp.]